MEGYGALIAYSVCHFVVSHGTSLENKYLQNSKVFSNTPSATQSAGKQVSPADSEAVQHREITTHTHTHMSTHTSTHTNNPVFVML